MLCLHHNCEIWSVPDLGIVFFFFLETSLITYDSYAATIKEVVK